LSTLCCDAGTISIRPCGSKLRAHVPRLPLVGDGWTWHLHLPLRKLWACKEPPNASSGDMIQGSSTKSARSTLRRRAHLILSLTNSSADRRRGPPDRATQIGIGSEL